MDISLNLTASRMQMLENWQATIAGNLANVSTPGYQKQTFEIAIPKSGEPGASTALGMRAGPVGTVRQSFIGGSLRASGSPYHMAVQGGGFFALSGEQGETLYTKDGEFHLDATGVLVNKMGYPVQAEGDSLQVNLEEGAITVATDGTVSQNGESVGRISVFNFKDPAALERLNGSYFSDRSGTAGAVEEETPTVLQGHLMGSSVSPLSEMINMIEVSRAYQITQKLIHTADERMDRSIQAFSV